MAFKVPTHKRIARLIEHIFYYIAKSTDERKFFCLSRALIYDGFQDGGYAMPGPQENPPLGLPMQPGETRMVNYGITGMKISPQTLTILRHLPNHYLQGDYATVTINK